jgi:hypothetical protein
MVPGTLSTPTIITDSASSTISVVDTGSIL